MPTNKFDATGAESSKRARMQSQSLLKYVRLHSQVSNDFYWLHEFLSSDSISQGKCDPLYLVRVYYIDSNEPSSVTSKDFGPGRVAELQLKYVLASADILAVILCHNESSQVDPKVLDILWTTFPFDVSFLRSHLDYKNYREEKGCSVKIRACMDEESENVEETWSLGGRWNPIRLPSETHSSILRLSVSSECLSVVHHNNVVLGFVRSSHAHQTVHEYKDMSIPDVVSQYNAPVNTAFGCFQTAVDPSELASSIVYHYARRMVLKCYEDYYLEHDTEPINLRKSDRISPLGEFVRGSMHQRRLELVKLKQNLSGYLGLHVHQHEGSAAPIGLDTGISPQMQRFNGLLIDIEALLSMYNCNIGVYEWYSKNYDSQFTGELANQQLDEAYESKATAISLRKLSNAAFLFLPLNYVCSMLGMNLSIFGQGSVPFWVFILLTTLLAPITYLPIFLPEMKEWKIRMYKVTYHLAKRSLPAAFWFWAFYWTHNERQNLEIVDSGLSQILLGYEDQRRKGWFEGRDDQFFEQSRLGNQAFWKDKVKRIYLAVEGLTLEQEATILTV